MSPDELNNAQPTPTPDPAAPAPEPVAEPVPEPTPEPITEPALEPTSEPVAESTPAPEPETSATEPTVTPEPTAVAAPAPAPEAPAAEPTATAEPAPTAAPAPAQAVPTPAPATKNKKLPIALIIVIAVLALGGGIFGILMAVGVINFGGAGFLGLTSSYSIPTAEKIEEVCKNHNLEFRSYTNTSKRFILTEAPYDLTVSSYICSNVFEVDIIDKEYVEVLSDIIKANPDKFSGIEKRPSGIAAMVSKMISYSDSYGEHTMTFSPITDTNDYYFTKGGENGDNTKGYLVIYKTAMVQTNDTKDETRAMLKELGLAN